MARGRLKIFFGFAPGVGKTYAMLEAAREKKREALERRAANAPAPGAKPKRTAANAPTDGNGSSARAGGADGDTAAAAETDQVARNSNPASRAPRPGAKPKKRRR